jgi:hypothetical protein
MPGRLMDEMKSSPIVATRRGSRKKTVVRKKALTDRSSRAPHRDRHCAWQTAAWRRRNFLDRYEPWCLPRSAGG